MSPTASVVPGPSDLVGTTGRESGAFLPQEAKENCSLFLAGASFTCMISSSPWTSLVSSTSGVSPSGVIACPPSASTAPSGDGKFALSMRSMADGPSKSRRAAPDDPFSSPSFCVGLRPTHPLHPVLSKLNYTRKWPGPGRVELPCLLAGEILVVA